MAEQSCTHRGQHWPSGTTRISPSLQTGRRQVTAEQSGAAACVIYYHGQVYAKDLDIILFSLRKDGVGTALIAANITEVVKSKPIAKLLESILVLF